MKFLRIVKGYGHASPAVKNSELTYHQCVKEGKQYPCPVTTFDGKMGDTLCGRGITLHGEGVGGGTAPYAPVWLRP